MRLPLVLLAAAAVALAAAGARAQTSTVLTKAEFDAAFPSADGTWPADSLADNTNGKSFAEVNALPGFSDRGVNAVGGVGFSYWANADYPSTNTGPTGKVSASFSRTSTCAPR